MMDIDRKYGTIEDLVAMVIALESSSTKKGRKDTGTAKKKTKRIGELLTAKSLLSFIQKANNDKLKPPASTDQRLTPTSKNNKDEKSEKLMQNSNDQCSNLSLSDEFDLKGPTADMGVIYISCCEHTTNQTTNTTTIPPTRN